VSGKGNELCFRSTMMEWAMGDGRWCIAMIMMVTMGKELCTDNTRYVGKGDGMDENDDNGNK
jgi:hypothetical protein